MVQTYNEKQTNTSIKFDMKKDDIITDTTAISKNHNVNQAVLRWRET